MLNFSNEKIEIPEEMKITLWRFNDGNKSPYGSGTEWNLSAKSVISNNDEGIFGVQEEQARMYLSPDLLNSFACESVYLKLEADRRNILGATQQEITVSECNIIQVMQDYEFAEEFPLFKDILYWKNVSNNTKLTDLRQDFYDAKNRLQESLKHQYRIMPFVGKEHGFAHSFRVEKNMILLAKHLRIERNEIEKVRYFAYYHDLLRLTDWGDPQHGKRAADLIRKNRKHFHLNCLNDNELETLCFACENHTSMLRSKSRNPLIDICFDADRLDLMRCGTRPEPDKMATEIGAHFAENYECYLSEFQNFDYILF